MYFLLWRQASLVFTVCTCGINMIQRGALWCPLVVRRSITPPLFSEHLEKPVLFSFNIKISSLGGGDSCVTPPSVPHAGVQSLPRSLTRRQHWPLLDVFRDTIGQSCSCSDQSPAKRLAAVSPPPPRRRSSALGLLEPRICDPNVVEHSFYISFIRIHLK